MWFYFLFAWWFYYDLLPNYYQIIHYCTFIYIKSKISWTIWVEQYSGIIHLLINMFIIYIKFSFFTIILYIFYPWDWEVVGSNPGQFPTVIYWQSHCLLVRNSTLIIRGRSGMPRIRIMWQGHPDITNKVEKDVKSNQTNFYWLIGLLFTCKFYCNNHFVYIFFVILSLSTFFKRDKVLLQDILYIIFLQ